jgi:TolB-like protein
MASLQLVLLGGFQARAAGQEIDVPGRKDRALLAFLAIPAGEARSRDKLAGLLWSDRGDSQARESLKQAVFKLRKSLDGVQPSPLLADREFVSLEKAAVTVDVAEFEQLIGESTIESLARATALYRGDLLDGLDLRDAAFDEWLLMERQRLRDLAREALAKLVDWHISSGAHDQAAAAARRLLAIDPLREVAHRALMQIYAAQGQTALALKQYQLCRDALQNELGVKPEPETERLYQSIQEKRATARRTADQAPAAQVAAESRSIPDAPPGVHDPQAPEVGAKPSIAILPFTNLSGDPAQEYFADGIVEDIISGLTRLHWLFVIARDSSFVFKGKAIDVRQAGRELGVRYVLEGSVRKSGNRLRITAQLVEGATGAHLWARNFDGIVEDVALPDIVKGMPPIKEYNVDPEVLSQLVELQYLQMRIRQLAANATVSPTVLVRGYADGDQGAGERRLDPSSRAIIKLHENTNRTPDEYALTFRPDLTSVQIGRPNVRNPTYASKDLPNLRGAEAASIINALVGSCSAPTAGPPAGTVTAEVLEGQVSPNHSEIDRKARVHLLVFLKEP